MPQNGLPGPHEIDASLHLKAATTWQGAAGMARTRKDEQIVLEFLNDGGVVQKRYWHPSQQPFSCDIPGGVNKFRVSLRTRARVSGPRAVRVKRPFRD